MPKVFVIVSSEILQTVQKLCEKYKSPFRFWIGSRLYFFITQPRDLEVVLKSSHSLNKDVVYTFFEPFLGQGLITSKGNLLHLKYYFQFFFENLVSGLVWKLHRRIIAKGFNQNLLNAFIPIFKRNANSLAEVLAKETGKGVFNAKHALSRFTLDSVCGECINLCIFRYFSTKTFCFSRNNFRSKCIFTRSGVHWFVITVSWIRTSDLCRNF